MGGTARSASGEPRTWPFLPQHSKVPRGAAPYVAEQGGLLHMASAVTHSCGIGSVDVKLNVTCHLDNKIYVLKDILRRICSKYKVVSVLS